MLPYKFKNFLQFLERAAIRMLMIGLVLLVAVQFVLINSNLEERLVARIPWTEEILQIAQNNQQHGNVPAAEVFSPQRGREVRNYLEITLQSGGAYEEVQLIIDGDPVGNFATPQLKVDISPGNQVAIDARGIEEGLWFRLKVGGLEMTSFSDETQIWVKNEYKVLGEVKRGESTSIHK